MSAIYSVILLIVTTAHLGIGIGNILKVPSLTKYFWKINNRYWWNIFQVPPYNPAVFLASGKPGTGETGPEKFLELILGANYTGSILAVILAYFLG